MKSNLKNIIVFFFILFCFIKVLPAQGFFNDSLSYNIYRVYPAFSCTKEKFNEAKTIVDINNWFKPSWVKEYVSVEVNAFVKGQVKKAIGLNDTFTQDQINLINLADLNSQITVTIKYYPDNTLSVNDEQKEEFKFSIDPEADAKYSDDEQEMLQYLSQNIIDKIPDSTFINYKLAAVAFSVNEQGEIFDIDMLLSSGNESVDKLLYETIYNMQNWIPAQYLNGTKVKQDFVLTVGDMRSCNTNLINIRDYESLLEEN